jgi:hypothetical protein
MTPRCNYTSLNSWLRWCFYSTGYPVAACCAGLPAESTKTAINTVNITQQWLLQKIACSTLEMFAGHLPRLHQLASDDGTRANCPQRFHPWCYWCYTLYRKLPIFTTKLPRFTTKLPNSKFRAAMFYLCSGPKKRISERDISYPKKVPSFFNYQSFEGVEAPEGF